MKRTYLISVLILVCCVATGAVAQVRPGIPGQGKANARTPQPTPPPVESSVPADSEVIRVTTQLVSVPVRVMDKKGRFIGGLARESFRVFEDGVEQELAYFSNENEPFTVVLMLDMSYSTTFKIGEIQSAALAFIDQLRPQDKVMVVSFDQDVHVLCEATSDRREIYAAIKRTKISTGTSLYEAVDMVMNGRLRQIDGRKAIILFTDGVDTTSRRVNDLINLDDAMELDALIYPIRYDTFQDVQAMHRGTVPLKLPPIAVPSATPDPVPIAFPTVGKPGSQGTTEAEYRKAEEYLDGLAQRTGGRVYPALTIGNLTDAYARIASELREFYSIGYYPQEERVQGKRAKVRVKVDREGLVVSARDSFLVRKTRK